jgi:hypothetical protein
MRLGEIIDRFPCFSVVHSLIHLIDSIFGSGVQRIDDALYELESPMSAANRNATSGSLLSQIEKGLIRAPKLGAMFTSFLPDGQKSYQSLIEEVTMFSSVIADVLFDSKGVTRLISDVIKADMVISAARQTGDQSMKFLRNLSSFRPDEQSPDQKAHIFTMNTAEVQASLQELRKLTGEIQKMMMISGSEGLRE